MGLVSEIMSCVNEDTASWLSTEDPTFIVPSSVKLSPKQLHELVDAGIQAGAAFCLTNDGTLASPESKRSKLKMIRSFASISDASLQLKEVRQGKFSFQFKYNASIDTDCVIGFHVRDRTNSQQLEASEAQISWGPYRLPAGLNLPFASKGIYNKRTAGTSLSSSTESPPVSASNSPTTGRKTASLTKAGTPSSASRQPKHQQQQQQQQDEEAEYPKTVDYKSLPVSVYKGKIKPNYYDIVITLTPFKGRRSRKNKTITTSTSVDPSITAITGSGPHTSALKTTKSTVRTSIKPQEKSLYRQALLFGGRQKHSRDTVLPCPITTTTTSSPTDDDHTTVPQETSGGSVPTGELRSGDVDNMHGTSSDGSSSPQSSPVSAVSSQFNNSPSPHIQSQVRSQVLPQAQPQQQQQQQQPHAQHPQAQIPMVETEVEKVVYYYRLPYYPPHKAPKKKTNKAETTAPSAPSAPPQSPATTKGVQFPVFKRSINLSIDVDTDTDGIDDVNSRSSKVGDSHSHSHSSDNTGNTGNDNNNKNESHSESDGDVAVVRDRHGNKYTNNSSSSSSSSSGRKHSRVGYQKLNPDGDVNESYDDDDGESVVVDSGKTEGKSEGKRNDDDEGEDEDDNDDDTKHASPSSLLGSVKPEREEHSVNSSNSSSSGGQYRQVSRTSSIIVTTEATIVQPPLNIFTRATALISGGGSSKHNNNDNTSSIYNSSSNISQLRDTVGSHSGDGGGESFAVPLGVTCMTVPSSTDSFDASDNDVSAKTTLPTSHSYKQSEPPSSSSSSPQQQNASRSHSNSHGISKEANRANPASSPAPPALLLTNGTRITIQCVGHRYKTKGGVFNSMQIYGLEPTATAAMLITTGSKKTAQLSSNNVSGGPNGTNVVASNSSTKTTATGGVCGTGASAAATTAGAGTTSGECVICLESPKDTAMFPCRHLCVCMPCAAVMARQPTRCPICRVPATMMLQFKNPGGIGESACGTVAEITSTADIVPVQLAVPSTAGREEMAPQERSPSRVNARSSVFDGERVGFSDSVL